MTFTWARTDPKCPNCQSWEYRQFTKDYMSSLVLGSFLPGWESCHISQKHTRWCCAIYCLDLKTGSSALVVQGVWKIVDHIFKKLISKGCFYSVWLHYFVDLAFIHADCIAEPICQYDWLGALMWHCTHLWRLSAGRHSMYSWYVLDEKKGEGLLTAGRWCRCWWCSSCIHPWNAYISKRPTCKSNKIIFFLIMIG